MKQADWRDVSIEGRVYCAREASSFLEAVLPLPRVDCNHSNLLKERVTDISIVQFMTITFL